MVKTSETLKDKRKPLSFMTGGRRKQQNCFIWTKAKFNASLKSFRIGKTLKSSRGNRGIGNDNFVCINAV